MDTSSEIWGILWRDLNWLIEVLKLLAETEVQLNKKYRNILLVIGLSVLRRVNLKLHPEVNTHRYSM